MFLCLPEHQTKNDLVKKLRPVADGGEYWTVVIKENSRPMILLTVLLKGDVDDELTFVAADAFSLWPLSQNPSMQISALACLVRTHGSSAWETRQVRDVWTLPGHEMAVAYLEFHDEPDALFDAYTLGRIDPLDCPGKKLLLAIRPAPKNRINLASGCESVHKVLG